MRQTPILSNTFLPITPNRALHMIAVVGLRYDPRTINYMQRRLAEGLSKKDVLRCLKRFIAREVFHALKTDLHAA